MSDRCKFCNKDLTIKENCYFSTKKNGQVDKFCRYCSKARSTARQAWRRENEPGFREAQNKRIKEWRQRTGDLKSKKKAVERDKKRMATDRSYKIKKYLRNRLGDALRGKTKSQKLLIFLAAL